MKHIVGILVLLAGLNAFAVREVQNGGGGVSSVAGMETFLSANFRLNGKAEEIQKIPGLVELMKELEAMPLKDDVKGRIFAALFPTNERQYFRIKKEEISKDTRESLVDQFAKIMRVPRSKVVLFAASAPASKTTVLLEEFYQLKINEQKAMLLHEALWIMDSNLEYEQVISIEQEAQAYFQDHSNLKAFYNFVDQLADATRDRTLLLNATLQMDFMTGTLKSSSTNLRSVRLVDLVGEKYLDCMLLHDFNAHKTVFGATDYVKSCTKVMVYSVTLKAMSNPNSLFYQGLLTFLGRYELVDLLIPTRGPQNRMSFLGTPAAYANFRNGLHLIVTDQIAGNFMDMTVIDGNGNPLGYLHF
ncbi:hypothetical protein ACLSU7_05885 [Bdellovibrio sp. HCB185ZH]|uniref:hypothetical protein n=1 Tax=Bdellovibrio sp. HCB185ZH TaxID=3394235 RepID=UPI0039A4C28A